MLRISCPRNFDVYVNMCKTKLLKSTTTLFSISANKKNNDSTEGLYRFWLFSDQSAKSSWKFILILG